MFCGEVKRQVSIKVDHIDASFESKEIDNEPEVTIQDSYVRRSAVGLIAEVDVRYFDCDEKPRNLIETSLCPTYEV